MQASTEQKQIAYMTEPPLLPADAPLLIHRRALEKLVGVSRATIHREVKAGRFPRPIHVAAQKTAWLKTDVEAWLANRVADRDRVAA